MPSTKNETLELIQREIMDVMEREKELRDFYNRTNNNNNNNEVKTNGEHKSNGEACRNGIERPPLVRAQSTSVLTVDGEAPKNGNFRRFTTNPNNVRGVMQRFIKSRGKINAVTTIAGQKQSSNWSVPDLGTAKVTVEQGKRIRNGFVPAEERMKQEIQEAHKREVELRFQRRKSQPDFSQILDLDAELEQPKVGGLRATKSMAQLYDSCENLTDSPSSAPSSLKPARSLAELCDATEDEIQTPQSLIVQFENIISKNRQAART